MSSHRSQFNQRMQQARKASGRSLDEAWADARALYPETPSRSTIARLEQNPEAEHDADPVLITVLADLYNTTVAELSPEIAERARRAVLVLVGGHGPDGGFTSRGYSTPKRRTARGSTHPKDNRPARVGQRAA